MPPPPIPNAVQAKTVTPMTPASLMNLGGGKAVADMSYQEVQGSKRQVGRAAQTTRPVRKTGANGNNSTGATNGSGSGSNAAGSANGKKLKIAPAGKRALAARPPGVGVRAGKCSTT
jgi:hypothetical protein